MDLASDVIDETATNAVDPGSTYLNPITGKLKGENPTFDPIVDVYDGEVEEVRGGGEPPLLALKMRTLGFLATINTMMILMMLMMRKE